MCDNVPGNNLQVFPGGTEPTSVSVISFCIGAFIVWVMKFFELIENLANAQHFVLLHLVLISLWESILVEEQPTGPFSAVVMVELKSQCLNYVFQNGMVEQLIFVLGFHFLNYIYAIRVRSGRSTDNRDRILSHATWTSHTDDHSGRFIDPRYALIQCTECAIYSEGGFPCTRPVDGIGQLHVQLWYNVGSILVRPAPLFQKLLWDSTLRLNSIKKWVDILTTL